MSGPKGDYGFQRGELHRLYTYCKATAETPSGGLTVNESRWVRQHRRRFHGYMLCAYCFQYRQTAADWLYANGSSIECDACWLKRSCWLPFWRVSA